MSLTRRGLALLGAVAMLALVLPGLLAGLAFLVALVVCLTDAWLVRRVPIVTVTAPPIVSRGVPSGVTIDVEPSVGLTVRQVGHPMCASTRTQARVR